MRILWLFPAALLGVVVVACEPISEPIPDDLQPQFSKGAGPVVESVTGGAHFTSRRTGAWRTFSLSARKYANESVEGMFQVNNHGASWFKGVITCFSIDGNQAWLGGIVTSSSDVLAPGDEKRILWVQDNGEGANAQPDRARGIPRLSMTGFSTLQEYCDAQPFTPERFTSDLEAGNIQIKQKQ